MSDEKVPETAIDRLATVLPHMRLALKMAAIDTPDATQVEMAIVVKRPDKSGRLTCAFEGAEFLDDLESVVTIASTAEARIEAEKDNTEEFARRAHSAEARIRELEEAIGALVADVDCAGKVSINSYQAARDVLTRGFRGALTPPRTPLADEETQ